MRPVTVQPGYDEADVDALLATRSFNFTDLFTITPLVGSPLRLTDARKPVTVVPVGGTIRQTYQTGSVIIKGLRSHTKIGVSADEQQITLDYRNEPDYQGRLSWPEALKLGYLDGATVQRDRAVAAHWADDLDYPWLGVFPMFRGVFSGLSEVGRQTATISVKSELNALGIQMPRDLFLPNCKNTWGDLHCGVDQSIYAQIVTISAGTPTATFLPWTGASADFVEGKVYIDNGDGVTRVRKIQRADTTGLWLVFPLDFLPIIGSTFTAYPGCAGTTARCLFFHGADWVNRFAGTPFIPVAESAA
jgi:hypothetical protein